jgi:AAA domain-containing protein/DnaB helicase-like protein
MPSGNGRRSIPADIESEAAFLGTLLLYPGSIELASRLVRPEHFYKPLHQWVFATMVECWHGGQPITVDTVRVGLARGGLLEQLGGGEALLTIQHAGSTPEVLPRLAALIVEAAQRRAVIAQAADITTRAFDWGTPLERVYDLLSPPAALPAGSRYLSALRDPAALIAMPPPSWLIDGFIPAGGLVVTYGPPKSAKTFLTLHEALCVATGSWFFATRVERRRVLYVVAEGGRALGVRLDAWCSYHQVDPATLPTWISFLPLAVPLADPAAVSDVRRVIDDRDVGLVIIDTLARCMVGGDENSSRDMTTAVGALDELRGESTTVHAIHHVGKHPDAGMRGHSSLLGAVDTAIEVTGDGHAFKVAVTAQKDAVAAESWWGKLVASGRSVVVETGRPPEGDPAFSREATAQSISELLESRPGIAHTGRDITDALPGRDQATRAALKWLVAEGYVTATKRKGSAGAVDHVSVRPYRAPVRAPEPNDEPF